MSSLIDIIIPPRCINCSRIIPRNQHLCINCLNLLPYTHWNFRDSNLINENFKGEDNFLGGTALLYYEHGNITSKLLQANKFYNQPNVGKLMSQLSFSILDEIDFKSVIPVPSHTKTIRERGYTQTHTIAKTIAEHYQVPFYSDCLQRVHRKTSQTKKNKEQRLLLPKKDFLCNFKIKESNVLLVDDIITTGGTLKACINAFKEKNDAGFYLFSLAQTN